MLTLKENTEYQRIFVLQTPREFNEFFKLDRLIFVLLGFSVLFEKSDCLNIVANIFIIGRVGSVKRNSEGYGLPV